MNKTIQLILLIAVFCAPQFGFSQVGINTTTPISTLDINGNLNVKEIGLVNAKVSGSATFTGGSSGSAKLIDDGVYISMTPVAQSGLLGPEFILPNAANVPGRIYILRNVSNTVDAKLYTFGGGFYAKDSNTVTVAPVTLPANGLFKTLILVSDGINWTYIF